MRQTQVIGDIGCAGKATFLARGAGLDRTGFSLLVFGIKPHRKATV
jgi:hypothetical protein